MRTHEVGEALLLVGSHLASLRASPWPPDTGFNVEVLDEGWGCAHQEAISLPCPPALTA